MCVSSHIVKDLIRVLLTLAQALLSKITHNRQNICKRRTNNRQEKEGRRGVSVSMATKGH